MTKCESQGVSQSTLQDKLKRLGQSKFFYMEYMNSSDEDKQFLEYVVDTILTKGYMPA